MKLVVSAISKRLRLVRFPNVGLVRSRTTKTIRSGTVGQSSGKTKNKEMVSLNPREWGIRPVVI